MNEVVNKHKKVLIIDNEVKFYGIAMKCRFGKFEGEFSINVNKNKKTVKTVKTEEKN